MTRRRLLLLTLIIILCLYGSQLNAVSAQELAELKGRIVDEKGNGVTGASVVIMDWFLMKTIAVIKSDENGYFQQKVRPGHDYGVYTYLDIPATQGIDYGVSKTRKTFYAEPGSTINIPPIRLIRGASINMTSEIWYVKGGRSTSSMRLQVIDPVTENPLTDLGDYTPFYGDDEPAWYINRVWSSIAIIPAGRMVDIKVVARVYGDEAIETIEFKIDNGGKHFYLSQGNGSTVDLRPYAFQFSLKIADDAIKATWGKLYAYRQIGFYVVAQEEELRRAQLLIDRARGLIANGDFSLTCKTLIREAYTIATRSVMADLRSMEEIAMLGALTLPAFLSVCAISLSFFFFENDRKKIVTAPPFYGAIILLFYLVYPGVHLVIQRNLILFIEVAGASVAATLFITFILPKFFKEVEGAIKIGLRETVAVTFMLAKRYVKIRKGRSFLTITSILLLVTSLTTLTSVSSIFGIQSEYVTATLPVRNWLFLKAPGKLAGTFTPIDVQTAYEAARYMNSTALALKVENSPAEIGQVIGTLNSSLGAQDIFGVIGIKPADEKKFTSFRFAQGDLFKEEDLNAVLVSSELARKLGLSIGGKVSFSIVLKGFTRFYDLFTITGVIDNEDLSQKKDLNGDSFLPLRYILDPVDKKTSLVPCNASQVIIVNWKTALSFATTPFNMDISISRAIMDLAKTYGVEEVKQIVKGMGLHAWMCQDDRVTHLYYGSRLEVTGYTIVIPAIIVFLTVALTMYGTVEERRREIFIYTTLGFNPLHIALVFLAEGIIMGFIAGCLGYVTGLTVYRVLALASEFLRVEVRENLNWWMSIVGVATAVLITSTSSLKSVFKAAMMATPSLKRKIKIEEKKRIEREEDIFKAFTERQLTLPIRVQYREIMYFEAYLYDHLKEMVGGYAERVENVKEIEEVETVKGGIQKTVKFDHVVMRENKPLATSNKLIMMKSLDKDYYTVMVVSNPREPGIPETVRERTMHMAREIAKGWVEKRKYIVPQTP